VKFLIALCVVLSSYLTKFYPDLFYLWLAFATTSIIYAYYWDVKKDWKFF